MQKRPRAAVGFHMGRAECLIFKIKGVSPKFAVLCDVVEGRSENLKVDKGKVLDQLVAKEFVEVMASQEQSPAKYKLANKAQQLLAERGVGLSGG